MIFECFVNCSNLIKNINTRTVSGNGGKLNWDYFCFKEENNIDHIQQQLSLTSTVFGFCSTDANLIGGLFCSCLVCWSASSSSFFSSI